MSGSYLELFEGTEIVACICMPTSEPWASKISLMLENWENESSSKVYTNTPRITPITAQEFYHKAHSNALGVYLRFRAELIRLEEKFEERLRDEAVHILDIVDDRTQSY